MVPALGEQLQSLTPLRGIAALWVVVYHYVVTYFSALHSEHYTQILAKGYLAVDLFFLLSGFVLTHVYQAAFTQSVGANYRDFLSARVARIYPLHVFVLLLFLTTAMASSALHYATTGYIGPIPLEGARSLSAIVANLFMVQGLKASELSWNYPAWSVSVEFIAYLGFPFALPWIWRARWLGRAVLGLLLVGVLGYFAYLTKDDFNQWDGPQTLLRCLPEFLLGTLLYGVYRDGLLPVAISRDAVLLIIAATTIVLLHTGLSDLLTIIVFAGLILAAVTNRGRVAGLLNTRLLTWLGDISYSLYLVHGFVQYVTTKLLSAFGSGGAGDLSRMSALSLTLAMVAASLLIASITYGAVERAGRRYLRDLFRVRKPSASGARHDLRFASRDGALRSASPSYDRASS